VSLKINLSDDFLMILWAIQVWRKRIIEAKYNFNHMISSRFITIGVDSDHCAKIVFIFSNVKLLFLPDLHTTLFF
jgi:hypothetical protein